MKVLLFLLLIFSMDESKSASHHDCLNLFKEGNYAEIIRQCEAASKDNVKVEFMYFASLMFMDIDYPRINHIFFNGKQMGTFVYKYKTGKNLYTNLEKYHFKNYFPKLVEFADHDIPLAQLLTAKFFYINVGIIKRGEEKERSSASFEELDQGMKQYYLLNLEKIIAVDPNHVEALALLGLESFNHEYIEGQFDLKTRYYSIKDDKLYGYLLQAHDLGHPGIQEIIDGVAAWNRHIQAIEKQAKTQDPEAIFLLGQNAFRKSHDNKRFLEDALMYFQQAADLGHEDALRSVNSLYGNELFDKEKYLSTLKKLVVLNDTKAMVRLGDIYLCNGCKDEAETLYKKAVALKDPIAPYALDDLKIDGEPSAGCR